MSTHRAVLRSKGVHAEHTPSLHAHPTRHGLSVHRLIHSTALALRAAHTQPSIRCTIRWRSIEMNVLSSNPNLLPPTELAEALARTPGDHPSEG
jgi:hypothetical protein